MMRVALFVTCLVDMMRPEIGVASLKLLRAAGCEVFVPSAQTCCGQPAYNSGERNTTRALAIQFIEQFEGFDYIVLPSGSCAGMIKTQYDDVLKDEPIWRARMAQLNSRIYELSQFLYSVARPKRLPLQPDLQATFQFTYHDSCSGLRELGIAHQPRALLAELPNANLVEMKDCRSCCGFGGSFAVKYGAISSAIVDDKCAQIQETGTDAVVLGDLGCMLNIEGRLRRQGDQQTQVLHFAQLLVGDIATQASKTDTKDITGRGQ